MATAKKFRSYCITVRHRNGVQEGSDFQKRFVAWLAKQDYAVCVAEMEGSARHLHAQIWFENPKTKASVCRTLERISAKTVPDWDKAQRAVQFGQKGDKNKRGGVRIATSDWHLSYLLENEEKGAPEAHNILLSRAPEDTEEFYPTQEEQEAAKSKGTRAVDYKYAALEERYYEWCTATKCDPQPVTYQKVAHALTYSMFHARTMQVLRDPKTVRNTCQMLTWYIQKTTNPEWMYGFQSNSMPRNTDSNASSM